jgi:hypothetical protein
MNNSIPSLACDDPKASFKIVGKGKIHDGVWSGIYGYYTRSTVGIALTNLLIQDPTAEVRVEPYNRLLASADDGKALRSSDVEWIVNGLGELGVKIGDQMLFCYKGESIMYAEDIKPEDPEMYYRPVGKREFGESIKYANGQGVRYTKNPNGGEDLFDMDERDERWRLLNTKTANPEIQYHN